MIKMLLTLSGSFLEPIQGYHKTVMVQGGGVLPDSYLLASVSTEEVVVLVIRYSSQYSRAP